MNMLVGTAILVWLLVGCVLMAVDVWRECRFQTDRAEREELLDRLWGDEAA